MSKVSRITMIGAGPGAADLISVRGWKALQTADVVLYDALISQELLAEIPEYIPTIYVGKRAGQHSFKQEDINALLVECAHLYGHAVRLKGGDSFVFGRGGEEINYARKQGVPTTVVPGISSAIGVPALCDVPVTHRGDAESFWVITGTTTSGKISKDVMTATTTDATVVILMGMNKLNEIASIYKSAGKGGLPVAIVQEGSTAQQQSVISTVDNVVKDAADQGVGAPAVIVIGKVVNSIVSSISKNIHEYSYSGIKCD